MFDWLADRYWRWKISRDRRHRSWEPGPRRHGLFPAYADWGGGAAVDRSGEVWYSESPAEWTDVRRVAEPELRHVALVLTANRYTQLAHLLPIRAPGDPVCPTCQGHGVPRQLPPKLRHQILCQCGGLGWIPVALLAKSEGESAAVPDQPSRPNDR